MRFPVELRLQPSPTITASVLAAHLAAALALFHVDAFVPRGGGLGDWLFAAVGWVLLAASLLRGLHAQRRLRECTMWLEDDGALELLPLGGQMGGLRRVRPGSQVVLAGAVWFEAVPFMVSGAAASTRDVRLMLVRDNLAGEGFRLLRAWLLHRAGRTRVAADLI